MSYGAQELDLSDTTIYPSLFRTVPNERNQYDGFIQLLNQFGWTWVGIVTSDDENNFQSSNEFKNHLLQNGACIAYYAILSTMNLNSYSKTIQTIQESSANVVIVFCTFTSFLDFIYSIDTNYMPGRVWILPATLSIITQETYLNVLNGSIMFTLPKGEIPGLKEYIYSANPISFPDDIFTAAVWRDAFRCLPANDSTFRTILGSTGNCTGKETLTKYESVFDVNNFRLTYAIYTATFAIAHGLHKWLTLSKREIQPNYNSFFQKAFQVSMTTLFNFISKISKHKVLSNGLLKAQFTCHF